MPQCAPGLSCDTASESRLVRDCREISPARRTLSKQIYDGQYCPELSTALEAELKEFSLPEFQENQSLSLSRLFCGEQPTGWQPVSAVNAHGSVRRVVNLSTRPGTRAPAHMTEPRIQMARRIAAILGCEFAGEFDPATDQDLPAYFVPDDALLAADAAALGIGSERYLFGGVVPHAFVATKVVSHPLVSDDAVAPEGWSHAFARDLAGSVLPGWSAFDEEDARTACARVLRDGPARAKRPCGIGGTGQAIVTSPEQLDQGFSRDTCKNAP